MIITIDGPAGTGKSTVAKALARRLRFSHFDTGAMYRAFSWFLLSQNIDLEDKERVQKEISKFSFEIVEKGPNKHYFVNEEDVTKKIRSRKVTSVVSKVAAYPFIRSELVKIQREFGKEKNAVFEGRDMGTVVFPKGDLKVFLTAKAKVRAERRYKELKQACPEEKVTFHQILKEIQDRDHKDSTRKASPLKKAKGAYLIDTSHLTPNQIIEKIIRKLQKKFITVGLFYRIIRFLAKVFFYTLFRCRVFGKEHIPPKGAIIASNHTSFLDPPLVSASCPFEVHFLARATLFKNKGFGWLIKKLNSHPIGKKGDDRATFKAIFKVLKNNEKILIFPEGERSQQGRLQKIKSGIGFICWKSHCPIVPVYIRGAYKAWPRNKKWPSLFNSIQCVYGSPIYFDQFKDLTREKAVEAIVQETEKSMHQLKNWLEKGAKGTPP